MGILRLALGEGTTNMKLFVFACLVAMAMADAEAEADPYYGYGHALGCGYAGYHGLGYGLGYRGYGYGLGGYYGKRSADAEPAAEPTAAAEAKADPYYGYYGH